MVLSCDNFRTGIRTRINRTGIRTRISRTGIRTRINRTGIRTRISRTGIRTMINRTEIGTRIGTRISRTGYYLVRAVSMKRVDPPIAVHASPITTPGGVVSYILSDMKIGFPT